MLCACPTHRPLRSSIEFHLLVVSHAWSCMAVSDPNIEFHERMERLSIAQSPTPTESHLIAKT